MIINDFVIPDNYIEVTELEIIQKLLYHLLYEFHDICEENQLIYNAFGGTLLGAVRHQGIIPWDDDVDVSMPKPDYDKLKMILKANTRYVAFDFPQKNYIYPYMKLCYKDTILIENNIRRFSMLKLYIDVFPICGYPTENDDHFFQQYEKYKKGVVVCVSPVKASPRLIKKMAYPFKLLNAARYKALGYQYFLQKELMLQNSYSFEDSEYVLCQGAGWNQKGKLLKSKYLTRKKYTFGEKVVWGIEDYNDHLTSLYGDFMTPPPKENQCPQHGYRLFIKDKLLEEIRSER